MSLYNEMMRAHSFKSVFNEVAQPADSLAIGRAEFLAPVQLPAMQTIMPAQSAPKVKPSMNYDQHENIKALPELSPDSFPYKGGGLK